MTVRGWSSLTRQVRQPVVFPGDDHILDVMKTGTGKSRSIAIPELISSRKSKFVFDFQDGALARATSLYLSEVAGERVEVIDPFRVVDPRFLPRKNQSNAKSGLGDIDADKLFTYGKLDPITYVANSRSQLVASHNMAEAFVPPGTLQTSHWSDAGQSSLASWMLFMVDPMFKELEMLRIPAM